MKEKRINPHFYLCRRIIASVITLLICVAVLAVPNANKNEKLFNQKNASAIGWVGGEIVEYSTSHSNETITPNKWYRSPNEEYFVVFSKSEGNLVVYHDTKNGREPVWSSGPRAKDAKCVLQHDGNLVIYSPEATDGVLWNTETKAQNGASLFITDDGDLYLIDRYNGKLLWQSRPCMWPLPGSENNNSLYKIEKYNKYNHKYLEISNNRICQNESVYDLNAVATFDGEVVNVNKETNYVTIYHRKLDIYSKYGPLDKDRIRVKEGDKVKQNDILGKASGFFFSFYISTDNPRNNPYPNYVDPYLYIVPPKKALFIQPKY